MSNVIVANKYRLTKKIGEGSFGKIYSATYKNPKNEGEERLSKEFAIKIMTSEYVPYLINEISIYEKINGIKNVPSLYDTGKEGQYNYIVMDLLEQSLEDVRLSYGEQMSLKVVIHLSLQMVKIIEEIHEKGIIHRDLKPANFLLKTNEKNISEIYLIDFGLAKSFLDEKQRHYSLKTNEETLKNESFISYMFILSQKDKMELMNVFQYILLAIIPIVFITKIMKTYLPPYDDYKGNIEILIEVIVQLIVLCNCQ